ncbi:hypothetical protein FJY90_06550 [Candidatus Gottesmanbacteria bacterium]|nr:hypothetical protein [Candidatus Gottesmanbacteria bacterium]
MNVVTTTILRNNLADIVSEIDKQKYFLIAKKGKITSALVKIDFFEDLLALANKKYVESIKKARNEYQRGEVFTHDQIFGKL